MEVILKRPTNRQRLLKPIPQDLSLVKNLNVRKVKKSAIINFLKNTVSKPWGSEYLCGRNKNVEVWELYINATAGTSLHCHPNKDTLNIVLEGRVILETIKKREILQPGNFRLLKAGLIHKTINFSSISRARVLEIESPPNKYDLIRIKDDYGRESLGYVRFCIQKNTENHIKKHVCLSGDCYSNKGQSFILRKFIPHTKTAGRSISIYELFIRTMSFNDSKCKLLKKLKSAKSKNIILTGGSLLLHKNNEVLKLLPGNCIFDVPLENFNWSTKFAEIIIW